MRRRSSPPAMRQESHLSSTASLSPLEIWSLPSSTTYIFSCGDEDRVVPPPGAITETLTQRSDEGPASRCVYRKSKSERIDDEVRPVWRANLRRRIAEPGERQAHLCSMTDAFSRRCNSTHRFSESDADVPRPGQ